MPDSARNFRDTYDSEYPQRGGQRPQGQCLVLLLADAAVNDVNRLLNAL